MRSQSIVMIEQGNSPIFISRDNVDVPIPIPIDRNRRDHLQVHQGIALPARVSVLPARFCMRPHVLKIRESVQEFPADQVQVAVAVEVGEVGRGHAVDVDRLAVAGRELNRVGVLRTRFVPVVENQIHVPVQRAVGPFALLVPGVVPAVVVPDAEPDDQVLVAVAVIIDRLPLVRPRSFERRIELGVDRQFDLLAPGLLAEVSVLVARLQQPDVAVDVGNLDVANGRAEAFRRLEDREGVGHDGGAVGLGTWILEEVDAVVRLVRAGDDQVQVAVLVVVHRQRPGPEADAQVDDQAGVVVGNRLQLIGCVCLKRDKHHEGEDRCRNRGSAIGTIHRRHLHRA